jgi:hypothetical protein
MTCTVNVLVPAAVGVPEITPVLAFKDSPAGNVPVLSDHVYGENPPIEDRVAV